MQKLLLLCLCLVSLNAQNLFMEEVDDEGTVKLLKSNSQRINDSNTIDNRAKTEETLSNLFTNIQERKRVIRVLEGKISNTEDKSKSEALKIRLAEEVHTYKQMQASLIQLSIGSVDIEDLKNEEKKEKINLDKSIDDIFEPFAIMLMRFTQVPRQIENLNLELQNLEQKIKKLDTAIKILHSYTSLSVKLKLQIDQQASDFAQQRLILLHQRNALISQLKKLQTKQDEPIDEFIEGMKTFFNTHGITLIYALAIFFITSGLLYFFKNILENHMDSKQRSANEIFVYRLSSIFISFISIILSISLAIGIIYIRSDWLVLAIVIFILLVSLWSLKNTLPRYFQELLLMLNVGVVREDEQVVFMGVPYIVEKISYHAIINNKMLSNAKTRIPLNVLETLHSRVVDKNEPLFPTQVNDFIFIEKTYAKVLFQSPTLVEVTVKGSAVKSYPTSDFLKLKPLNISKNGFSIIFEVSLDHKHRNDIIQNISKMLEKGLIRGVQAEDFSKSMESLKVEYSEANLDSLNLKVLASFKGEVAGSYHHIDRTLRAYVLEQCNKNAWKTSHHQLRLIES